MEGMMTRDMLDMVVCISASFVICVMAHAYEFIFGGNNAAMGIHDTAGRGGLFYDHIELKGNIDEKEAG